MDRKHPVYEHVSEAFHVRLGLHSVEMITSNDLSQEKLAIGMLTAGDEA